MTISTSLLTLLATFFYINQPVVDMRESPMHASKIVSQTIFSEEALIKEENGEWSYVASPDGYLGWIPTSALAKSEEPYEGSVTISRLAAHVYGVKDTEYGPMETLPHGAKLQALDTQDARWMKVAFPSGKEVYIQKGDVIPIPLMQNKKDLVAFSQRFIGLPYTWGGRSSFGYDCSGFVQMLYNQIGINLQRDSKQQILDARLKAIPLNDLEPGDLIFFGKSEQRIMHVGMYLGEEAFIHATARECRPWLRISKLTDPEWAGTSDVYYPYRTARKLTAN